MRERGVDEAEARRISRGHGTTPEHGRIRDEGRVAGRRVLTTKSEQAATRIIRKAARVSEERLRPQRETSSEFERGKSEREKGLRVGITVTDKKGVTHELYKHPSRGHTQQGISAGVLSNQIKRGGVGTKGWLAVEVAANEDESPEVGYGDEYDISDFDEFDPEDIDEIEIEIWNDPDEEV